MLILKNTDRKYDHIIYLTVHQDDVLFLVDRVKPKKIRGYKVLQVCKQALSLSYVHF